MLNKVKMRQSGLILVLISGLLFERISARITPLVSPPEGEVVSLQPVTWPCKRELRAISTWKHFSSNGWPNRINVRHSRCTWRITAPLNNKVRIAFRGLKLRAGDPRHCGSDYIEIIDMKLQKSQARYCGNQVPGDIVSKGRAIRIDFQGQQGRRPNQGFAISYAITTSRSGFYSSKSFDPAAPRSTTQPSQEQLTTARQDDQRGSPAPVPIGTYVGVGIGILALIVIAFLVWRRIEVIKKQKQKEKDSTLSTRSTDLDPRLPQNEIDPFERIASVCSNISPSIDGSVQGSAYINCQPPPLPRSNRPKYTNETAMCEGNSVFEFEPMGVRSSRSRISDSGRLSSQHSQISELPRSLSRSSRAPPVPHRNSFQSNMSTVMEGAEREESGTLPRSVSQQSSFTHQFKPRGRSRIVVPEKDRAPTPVSEIHRTTSRREHHRNLGSPVHQPGHRIQKSKSSTDISNQDFSHRRPSRRSERYKLHGESTFKKLSHNPPSRRPSRVSSRGTSVNNTRNLHRRSYRPPRSRSSENFKASY